MLHRFHRDISPIEPPRLFTWPFHYVPHPLAIIAAEEVQSYIHGCEAWREEIAAGKMFGVLVVRDGNGELGYIAAFSGNLEGRNHHNYFVPPVYDMLQPGEFFRIGEAEISEINRRIDAESHAPEYIEARRVLERAEQDAEQALTQMKGLLKQHKKERDIRRAKGEAPEILILESQRDNADMQRLKRTLRRSVTMQREQYDILHRHIEELKALRQQRSAALQRRIFEQFRMVNAQGKVKDLCELFASTPQGVPPAGAGECAAPKLLQYAYLNDLKPICMAEFWQGASTRGEVRHHGAYYPACNSKCKPILLHMLEGLDVEPNPLLAITPDEPQILWEDDCIVAINKPCGMLSVEGKSGVRSVEEWAHERYPEATGPIIIHRLDQSTSGILLLAKDKTTHKALQEQFVTRTISKRYTALLDGVISTPNGRIDLAMKPDYENRPRQMVAMNGKRAITEYHVTAIEEGRTRIFFYPITGRTHQLRLHAAHPAGLNAPIVGDDIYGRGCHDGHDDGHRLCLHASMLTFIHPKTGKRITIKSEAEF